MDKKILIGGLVVIVAIITVVIMQQLAEEQPVAEQPVERLLVETPQIIGSVDTPGLA